MPVCHPGPAVAVVGGARDDVFSIEYNMPTSQVAVCLYTVFTVSLFDRSPDVSSFLPIHD